MFFFLSLFYITRDWRYKSGKTNSSTWFSVCAVKTKREGGGGGSFVSVGRNHRTAPKFGDCSNPSTISPPLLFISIYIVIECRVPYRRERAATDDRSAQATTTSLYFSVTSSATSRFFFFFSSLSILICPTGSILLAWNLFFHSPTWGSCCAWMLLLAPDDDIGPRLYLGSSLDHI